MRSDLLGRAFCAALSITALQACGDDAKPAADTAHPASDVAGDSAAPDTSTSDSAQDSTAADSAASDAASGDTAGMSPCEQACVASNPTGATMLQAWVACQVEACKQFDPASEEGGACVFMSWSPDNPTAACQDETRACFSGPDAGCKELVDLAAARCEPAELPMSEQQLGMAALCMINLGFNATPPVQALAWPLYMCAFGDPSTGCGQECLAGADACRACAADKCKPQYDACIANTSGTAITYAPPTGDKAQCQEAFRCVNGCAGP